MSDVPLGMFLSGGIDSAAITAAMSHMADGPIKTFSVAFAERDANELPYARMVAERFARTITRSCSDTNEFFDLLPRMIWHEDEPHRAPVQHSTIRRVSPRSRPREGGADRGGQRREPRGVSAGTARP